MSAPYAVIAASYDELHGQEQQAKLALIRPHISSAKNILDIGCGTGIATIATATGIDPSEELLAINREHKRNKEVVCCGAEQMPFDDQQFDAIISLTALHHCDIAAAITEMKRVTTDDAVFCFSLLQRSDNAKVVIEAIRKAFAVEQEMNTSIDIVLICKKK